MNQTRTYDEIAADAERAVEGIEDAGQRQAAFKRVLGSLLAANGTAALTPPPSALPIRKIAMEQKALLYCLLVQALIGTGLEFGPPELQMPLHASAILSLIAMSVLLFVLAKRLFNTSVAVALGLLGLIPFVGIIVLLFVNRKAMKVLRESGISIGFMGAKSRQIPVAP
jgi:hypothetical protein